MILGKFFITIFFCVCAILLCDATGGKEEFVNSINGNLKSIKFRRFIELPMPLIARWMTPTERTVIGLGNQKPCCRLEIKTAKIAELLLHDKRLNRLQHDDNDGRNIKKCSRGIEQSTEYVFKMQQSESPTVHVKQPRTQSTVRWCWVHKNVKPQKPDQSFLLCLRSCWAARWCQKKSLQQQRIGEAWKNHSGRYFVFARLDSE